MTRVAPGLALLALLLRVETVDTLEIQNGANFGAPYLQISGVDMDGENVGNKCAAFL